MTEKNEQLKQQRVQLDLQHVLLREQQRMLDDQDAQLRQLRYLKLLEDQRGLQQMQREEEEEQQAQQDQREWHTLEKQLRQEEDRLRQEACQVKTSVVASERQRLVQRRSVRGVFIRDFMEVLH